MRILHHITVFDTPDLAASSAFWAAMLGGTVEAGDEDWHTVLVDGRSRLGFQLAPGLEPPDWPDGSPQQLHLDLYVEELAPAHEEALALGARLLRQAEDPAAPEGFQVYADPAGHPFCLCWG
ncbi:VOC family protein [Zafaria sp. Z1313]|uniref:VOC family protein n=1 Tax=unclassified Zafaria TaxID=2828765 RepID=UPI002E75AEE1|nr:VOC family protein [Zafaria sp. J156]MEE1621881.1 VOC family protein [Zafaria sp. J156]